MNNIEAITDEVQKGYRLFASSFSYAKIRNELEAHHPREIAEAALGHVIGSDAERAYRRGDALQRRRVLMQD